MLREEGVHHQQVLGVAPPPQVELQEDLGMSAAIVAEAGVNNVVN